MVFNVPYPSILAAATPLDIKIIPSLGNMTKLYVLLLSLFCFTGFTFAAEHRFDDGRRFAKTFFGSRRNLRNSEPPGEPVWESNATSQHEPLAKRDPPKWLDPYNPDGLALIDYAGLYGSDPQLNHEQRIIEAIAQEFFFHDNEVNFYDAKSSKWFNEWAAAHHYDYLNAKASRPDLSIITWFAEVKLAWSGLICDADGCRNMPTSDYVRQVHRYRLHEARHVINTLKALEKASVEVHQYKAILISAKDDLAKYCGEFARAFFHQATKGKSWMCPAKMIQIIMMVVTAIITIAFAAVTLFNPVSDFIAATVDSTVAAFRTSTGSAVLAGAGSGYQGWVISIQTPLTAEALWDPIGYLGGVGGLAKRNAIGDTLTAKQNLDAIFDRWVDQSLSFIQPAPVGRDVPGMPVEWGVIGILEGFNSSKLHANNQGPSVYDQVEVKAGLLFRRYPLVQAWPEFETNHKDAQWADDTLVSRLSKVLQIGNRDPNDYYYYGFPDTFAVNIMIRLVNEDRTPMNTHQALEFFERNSVIITKRWRQLKKLTAVYTSEYIALEVPREQFPTPNIRVRGYNEYMSWASIMAGLTFDGAEAVKKNSLLKFRSSANALRSTADTGRRKRESDAGFNTMGHMLHEMYGNLDSLRELNVIAPLSKGNGNRKRDSEQFAIQHATDGNNDFFRVEVQGHYFENQIHHEECGTDSYTGNTYQNEQGCHQYLDDVVNDVSERIASSYLTAAGGPWGMSEYLRKRFSTYTMWKNVDLLREKEPEVHGKIFQNLKNSMVSKAYAEGNCFVRCGRGKSYDYWNYGPVVTQPNDIYCQTVCYDPISDIFEPLYGFGSGYDGPAELPPWSLSEEKMNRNAYQAYKERDISGFYPGSINLDPYVPLTAEDSPILPVCRTSLRIDTGLPCSCGDKFGSMTPAFANAVRLRGGSKQAEWRGIRSCLDRIKKYGRREPAIYLSNACNIIYAIVAPPGTGSAQETKDLGHYRENFLACGKYMQLIREYRDNGWGSRRELNRKMCETWAIHARDLSRGGNHKHQDFSYVNDVIQDNACKGYRTGDH